jgi:ankyrin repeat protein
MRRNWVLVLFCAATLVALIGLVVFVYVRDSPRRADAKLEEILSVNKRNGPTMVRELLKEGASIHTTGRDGTTTLMAGVLWPGGFLPDDCFKGGVDMNATDIDGNTALILLAQSGGGWNLATRLVAEGADVNVQRKDGNTAIMLAAKIGDAGTVQNLLQHKPNVRMKNAKGETALSLARNQLQVAEETVRLLEAYEAKE